MADRDVQSLAAISVDRRCPSRSQGRFFSAPASMGRSLPLSARCFFLADDLNLFILISIFALILFRVVVLEADEQRRRRFVFHLCRGCWRVGWRRCNWNCLDFRSHKKKFKTGCPTVRVHPSAEPDIPSALIAMAGLPQEYPGSSVSDSLSSSISSTFLKIDGSDVDLFIR